MLNLSVYGEIFAGISDAFLFWDQFHKQPTPFAGQFTLQLNHSWGIYTQITAPQRVTGKPTFLPPEYLQS